MKILVFGAGRMGRGAVYDLAHHSPAVEAITIADFDGQKAAELAALVASEKVSPQTVDAADYAAVVRIMRGHDAAISCVNYWHNAAS
jgi:saccharopine dehydrogenase-like NADP-dependent oxidoreductase